MKNIFLLLLVSIGLFTSCVENPEENPDGVAPIGDLQIDFDGDHFTSTTTTAVLDAVSLSIEGTDQEDGSYFRIAIASTPVVGTYTWDEFAVTEPGFSLEYHPASGDPYVAARDDSGPYASFADYTDTAQLVITSIDRVNKRISGTFKFTGVRFADIAQTAVNTKVFTNGVFYSLPYTDTVITNPEESNVLLTKVITTYPSDPEETTLFTYNGKKMVSQVTSTVDYEDRIDYTYSGNLITGTETREDGELTETETFEYNANNKLVTYVVIDVAGDQGIKETYVHNTDGSISVSRYSGDSLVQDILDETSIITFSNGEVIKIESSTGLILTYTYDTKNNPLKNVLGFAEISYTDGYAQGIAKNVLVGSLNGSALYTFSYTYTPLNFPLVGTESGGATATYFY